MFPFSSEPPFTALPEYNVGAGKQIAKTKQILSIKGKVSPDLVLLLLQLYHES